MSGPFPYNIGAGSATNFKFLSAQLEPLAIQPAFSGLFNHPVAIGATEYLIGAYKCNLGLTNLLAIPPGSVDPKQLLALSNYNLTGVDVTALAFTLNANAPIYPNAQLTYQNRIAALATLQPSIMDIGAGNVYSDFLPGPYGTLITGHYNLNMASIAWQQAKGATAFFPLSNQWIDTSAGALISRDIKSYLFPVAKQNISGILTGAPATASPAGSFITYIQLPSNWGAVTDPFSVNYSFRDDFLAPITAANWNIVGGATLTTFDSWKWLNPKAPFAGNSIATTKQFPNATGKQLILDVHFPANMVGAAQTPDIMFGFCSTTGGAAADYSAAHFVTWGGANFVVSSYENGVIKAQNFGIVSGGQTYRFRITTTNAGAAYEIQGAPENPPIGGNAWRSFFAGATPLPALVRGGLTGGGVNGVFVSDFRIT